MNLKIAILPGDGIGPEVVAQAIRCLQAVEETFNHQFTYTEAPVGTTAIDRTGNPLPDNTLQLCKDSDAVLLGAIGTPEYDANSNLKVHPDHGLLKLRKELNLFSNIRPIKTFPSLIKNSPLKEEIIKDLDVVVYRELTGGIYFSEKKLNSDGTTASDLCLYSEKEISRIAHLAFKAAKNRRKELTLIDKANVLESSKLWRKVVSNIAESYPEVSLNFLFADHAAMQVIINPSKFDVILTENMFGDIISDELSIISGAINLLASSSIGENNALFSPIHSSYSQAKGENIANPIAAILSAALLLEHFGLNEEGKAIRKAVNKSIEKNIVTSDIDSKSSYGTSHVGDFISDNIIDVDDNLNMNDENIGLGKSTII